MDGNVAVFIVLVVLTLLSFIAGVAWLAMSHQRKMAEIEQRKAQDHNPELKALRAEVGQLLVVREELAELKALLHHQIIINDNQNQTGWLGKTAEVDAVDAVKASR